MSVGNLCLRSARLRHGGGRPGGAEVCTVEVHVGLKAVRGRSRPRVGLVLGAGGVLGAAWMTGALPALQERLPCPLGEVDLLIGTIGGSVLATVLRGGIVLVDMTC